MGPVTVHWVLLAVGAAVLAYAVGSRRRARRELRLLAAEVAALTGGPEPASLGELRTALAGLGAVLAGRQAEIDELRAERETSRADAQQEQRKVNHRLRRRAREAIDDTGAVIGERLREVVEQVGAAREAAAATHRRVATTSEAATVMVRRARSADEAATALNASLHQVAGVAGVIREIASQTRMLALNATIEAARAGAAGKGFAVVAGEVKNLADTTAESTEQIAATIAALEADVAQMGGTLAAIVDGVAEIESGMGLLDGIADDQHRIVERLTGTVSVTMAQIEDLSDVADRLERRRNERMAAAGVVRLRRAGGAAVDGRLVDVSSDGLGCLLPPGTTVPTGERVNAEMTLGGATFTVGATVVRAMDRSDGRELGLRLAELDAQARRHIEAYVTSAPAAG